MNFPLLPPRAAATGGLLLVAALFCAPLFIGLGGVDLRNDEAIYSTAVDRILATGEWLTPRSIQVDGPFLEKPPLKFWMVAAGMRSGLLPHDEAGFRTLDAVMGAVAFIYIYLFGLRISGPLAGIVAALTTFAFDPIVFDHGLRSNNMEAPLVLAYCGGLYHFMRWVDGAGRARGHAFAAVVYFVLGFMTKFVAVFFLPLVCALTILGTPLVRGQFAARWREWIAPAVAAVAAIAPWFVYESVIFGRDFWRVILGEHVYARFTTGLDPTHLQPWHFYFSTMWNMFTGNRFIDLAAIVALVATAWTGRPWQMRLLFLWWLVPFTLISLGTSKLIYYAYPFLPPVALSVGWLAAEVMAAAKGSTGAAIVDRLRRLHASSAPRARFLRRALGVIGAIAIAIALMSAVKGQIVWKVGGVKVLQNSTVLRPLVIGTILMGLAGHAALSVRALAAIALVVLLPVTAYVNKVPRVRAVDTRLRTIRDCAARVREANPAAAAGLYNAARTTPDHSDYYYLSQLGPWVEPEFASAEDVRRRLFEPGEQTLVRMTTSDHAKWRAEAHAEGSHGAFPPAALSERIAIVMPGPYEPCVAAAVAAGAVSSETAKAPGPAP